MAGDATTIARPYADAIFKHAVETDKLDLWSEMLELLAAAVRDPALSGLIANPKLNTAQMTDLMLEIGGGYLSEEGQNLVKLLAVNDRLAVIPEIADTYEKMKAEYEGTIDVHVVTAYSLKPAQEKLLSNALKAKLGKEVRITSEKDPELIGGFRLRAGDMVIDGSISGKISQLATELGI